MMVSLLIFFFCIFFIVFYNVHYLILLLFLEGVLLSVFIYLCWSFFFYSGLVGLFVFLLVIVCMGGFSISLLASVSRFFGRDFWYFRFIF